jgi:F0F1-type ATP synthase membrane subunit b/b'
MSTESTLQILLYLQIFIIGALVAFAWRHWHTHLKPAIDDKPQEVQPQARVELPPELKEHLLQESQTQFQTAMHNAATNLQRDLDATNVQVNELIIRLSTEMVEGELARYKEEITKLKDQAQKDMAGISAEVAKHETELKAKVGQEVEAEKQKLIKQIDTKLADAVGSFLSETLQHNVDLGSQSTYLVQMLEEHKADFVKEVSDENQPAK